MRNILLLLIVLISTIANSQTGYIYKVNFNDTLIGVVDLKGKVIIKNDYAKFRALHGYILATKFNEESSSLFDSKGFFIKDEITYFFEFGNNKHLLLHEYKKNKKGKWGLYSIKGQKITNFIYDDIIHSSELPDYGQVIKKSKYILIDTLGNELFSNTEKSDFKTQVRDFKKEKGIGDEDLMFDMSSNNYDEPEVFKDEKSSKYGLRYKGKTLVEPIYEEIQQMCCNCFVVKKDLKYGVVSKTGDMILKPDFDIIEDIGYWKIIASFEGKYGVYDARTGEILIKPDFGYLKFL